jgi:PAS domain S-box-containing protein
MDRVNRAIQGTDDIEQMMSDVLDAVLSIYDCDRAWLVYPCDPEAASWSALMEHVRPEYPGVFALGGDLPVDPEMAIVFQIVRTSSVPVRFGQGSENPIPEVAQRFSAQSQIATALYPKVDKPYMFGLHQCSHARSWTPQEERLLQEIGRRLADALTTLLMFRNLQESEARLEESQRIAHVGYWVRDLDTGHLTWSDETYRIFGLPPQDHTIEAREMEEFLVPEDRPIMTSAREEALAGHGRYDVEFRVVRPGGEVRTVHSQGEVTKGGSGRPSRMFGTIQDITERKRAEEALQQAQAELAHISRVTTLGELTSSIAHEINQPLTAVVTNGSACLRWLAAKPPNLAEARLAVERIIKDGNRAGEVIRRIRALVRHSQPQKELLDINEVIQEVMSLTHSEAQKYRVSVKLKLSGQQATVQGDRVQLQQVILNLMVNGIESMSEVNTDARELIISSSNTDARITVEVRDFGAGLDEKRLPNLFDAFYTTKPTGMGIGLAISRSIVEAHGGKIWAVPNSPRGAVFLFTLPVCEGNST